MKKILLFLCILYVPCVLYGVGNNDTSNSPTPRRTHSEQLCQEHRISIASNNAKTEKTISFAEYQNMLLKYRCLLATTSTAAAVFGTALCITAAKNFCIP